MGINSSGEFLQAQFSLGFGSQGTTAASLASALAAAINQGGGSYGISASSATQSTTQAQVTVNISVSSPSPVTSFVVQNNGGMHDSGAFPGNPSFNFTAPGGVPPTVVSVPAVTDTGTITATIDGIAASYSWGANDTFATVQSGLIKAIGNASWTSTKTGSSYLTATATSSGIQLTSLQTGYATNWPVSVAVSSSLGSQGAGFGANSVSMTGGVNAVAGATASGNYTTMVYSPGGSKLGTLQNGTLLAAEIPLPGGGTAMYNGSGLNYFRHADWLGSSRLATTWNHTIYSKTAYAPFGETYNQAGTADISFTGQDVDTSSGAYNFLFRKLDPVAGRWLSPDPSGLAYADLTNPQSLNLYAYVLNSPLTHIDPNGQCTQTSYYMTTDPACGTGNNPCDYSGGYNNYSTDCGSYSNYVDPSALQEAYESAGSREWINDLYHNYLTPLFDETNPDPLGLGLIGGAAGPNNGEPPSPCLVANINAVNSVSNLNMNASNVVGQPFIYNGGLDVNFSVPGGSPSQLPTGRYPSSFLNRVFGIGSSLHVPGQGGADPSTYGVDSSGNFTFTTHIDTAYSTWHTPIGALIHFFVDVRGSGAHRKPC